MGKCKFGIVNLHFQLASVTAGPVSATSARSCTARLKEEECALNVEEIGMT